MTTKEKKEYTLLAILLVATFAVIYFNFLKPKGSILPQGGIPIATVPPEISGAAAILPVTGATQGTGAFLPNGTSLNLDVLDNPIFKSLTPPVYPTVTGDEIGSDNIFGK
jgi:hypothetical protein